MSKVKKQYIQTIFPAMFLVLCGIGTLITQVQTVHALEPEQPSEYLGLAQAFANAMVEYGTDRYGPQHSPQFATILMRTNPPELPPDAQYDNVRVLNLPNIFKSGNLAHKITYRGGDVSDDVALYQLLYRLTEITGASKYAAAADASLRWFLAHAPMKESGLLPWGEHTGWDFRREHFDFGYGWDKKHEFENDWPYYGKFVALQPRVEPGQLTVMERFAKAIRNTHFGIRNGHLIYGRHGSMVFAKRPTEDPWDQYGVFPRHAGHFIRMWAFTWDTSVNPEFRSWMAATISEFVQLLSRQAVEHGYVPYMWEDNVTFSDSQLPALASDLDEAADRLRTAEPVLAQQMHRLASDIDDTLIERNAELKLQHAYQRWEHNRQRGKSEKAEIFKRKYYRGVEEIAGMPHIGERPIASKAKRNNTIPGRIPLQYATAIEYLLQAARITGGQQGLRYLARADAFAQEAITWFMDESSPLPKSLDRQPTLSDGRKFPHYYHSYLGGDDLMNQLLNLHLAKASGVR